MKDIKAFCADKYNTSAYSDMGNDIYKGPKGYIVENLIYEEGIYEYQINENIISQAYIIEVVVGSVIKSILVSLEVVKAASFVA